MNAEQLVDSARVDLAAMRRRLDQAAKVHFLAADAIERQANHLRDAARSIELALQSYEEACTLLEESSAPSGSVSDAPTVDRNVNTVAVGDFSAVEDDRDQMPPRPVEAVPPSAPLDGAGAATTCLPEGGNQAARPLSGDSEPLDARDAADGSATSPTVAEPGPAAVGEERDTPTREGVPSAPEAPATDDPGERPEEVAGADSRAEIVDEAAVLSRYLDGGYREFDLEDLADPWVQFRGIVTVLSRACSAIGASYEKIEPGTYRVTPAPAPPSPPSATPPPVGRPRSPMSARRGR